FNRSPRCNRMRGLISASRHRSVCSCTSACTCAPRSRSARTRLAPTNPAAPVTNVLLDTQACYRAVHHGQSHGRRMGAVEMAGTEDWWNSDQRNADQRLSKLLGATIGCAPGSRPVLFAVAAAGAAAATVLVSLAGAGLSAGVGACGLAGAGGVATLAG